MRKRSLSLIFVLTPLLFSAWRNVIAAAFCPRFALNRDCCFKRGTQQAEAVKHASSCHHEMARMEMDNMQMKTDVDSAQNSPVEFASEASSEEVALDLPIEPCAHCLSHSQPTSGAVSVAAFDPSKRVVETNSVPANFANGLTSAFADRIVPSEHGPPGPSPARHLIINVFRI